MGTNQYPKDVMAAVDIVANHRFNKKKMKNKTNRKAKMRGQPKYPSRNWIHKQVKSEGLQGQADQWNDSTKYDWQVIYSKQ
jgi:hypothetical protein